MISKTASTRSSGVDARPVPAIIGKHGEADTNIDHYELQFAFIIVNPTGIGPPIAHYITHELPSAACS